MFILQHYSNYTSGDSDVGLFGLSVSDAPKASASPQNIFGVSADASKASTGNAFTSGLFAAPATTGLFDKPIVASPNAATTPASGGLFGSNAGSGGGLFGAAPPAATTTASSGMFGLPAASTPSSSSGKQRFPGN